MISILQLQEQCGEQRQTLYIAIINLTKVFDLVSRDGLFRVLLKIGCPCKLLSVIQSFHTDMKRVVRTVRWLLTGSGVKQGCVLAPTFFGIFFGFMLRHLAFGNPQTESSCTPNQTGSYSISPG